MQRIGSRGDHPLRSAEQAQVSRAADGAIEAETEVDPSDPLRSDERRAAALRKILEPCTGGDGTTVVHKTTAVGRTEVISWDRPEWVMNEHRRRLYGSAAWSKPYRGDVQ